MNILFWQALPETSLQHQPVVLALSGYLTLRVISAIIAGAH